MSRLTVTVLAILTIAICVRCLAEPLDAPERLGRKDEPDHVEVDPEDVERSTSPQGHPSINNRVIPGGYLPTKIRLAECYACADCPRILPNTTSKYCPYTNDFSKNNKCIVYAEKYRQMEKPWYTRGCATERGSCADLAMAHENANSRLVKLVYCSECEGDKCNTNGVYRSLPNLTIAALFIIITPLIGKYTLS